MSGNNVIIGANAVLPVGATLNAIVLGSADSTVYLAGGAMRASATALTLTTPLIAGGSAGTSGQILKSTGGGIEWAAANTAPAAALSFTSDTAVTPANSVYVLTGTSAAVLSLPAVNTLVGVPLMAKNQSTGVLTVSGAALVAPGSTAVIATAPIASGGSCQIVSDGTNWLMIDAAGAPPVHPGAPTSVAITQPAANATPTTLTVTYNAPANATSFLVQIAQIIDGSPVYVGSASAAVSTSPMSVAVPATAGAYNTMSTNPFQAFITPYNGWAPGTIGNSVTYMYGLPSNVVVATPTPYDEYFASLTVTWTAPAFLPTNYRLELIKGNGDIIHVTSTTDVITTLTVEANIYTADSITAKVTVSKDTYSANASSIGYYWAVPTWTFTNRNRYGGTDQFVTISGGWTIPYKVTDYNDINLKLYRFSTNGAYPAEVVQEVTLDRNINSFNSAVQEGFIEETDITFRFYYVVTYNPNRYGYIATQQSGSV